METRYYNIHELIELSEKLYYYDLNLYGTIKEHIIYVNQGTELMNIFSNEQLSKLKGII